MHIVSRKKKQFIKKYMFTSATQKLFTGKQQNIIFKYLIFSKYLNILCEHLN